MSDGTSTIADRAAFGQIRYAQLWEDADVLVEAMGDQAGKRLVSICSAGDNALALLLLDPERVVALDLSQPQIECLNLRLSAYRSLEHQEFLELMGARPSNRRRGLLQRALASASPDTRRFWQSHEAELCRWGAGGIGRFERYFRLFRRYVLPLTHARRTIDQVFVSREAEDRRRFYDTAFNTWRWRLLMRAFFSRFAMARLGRDPAFFEHVDGSVADHVARRVEHAAVTCDPALNPYLHWILKGGHGAHLPLPWRADAFATIRDRLDRIEVRRQTLEAYLADAPPADGFNLSDIFEYMPPDGFHRAYGQILGRAQPGARLVYWNMMVPRRVPPELGDRVETLKTLEDDLKTWDKAFFYSDFVIEQVM
ncbi:MAG: DUF3419 family protein [Pseudomonadota bacterium]